MRGRRRSPPVSPRKAPQQDRSRALVEWIVEGATRILAADGLTGLTTNRVAEVAGISVGSLYQYFPNKDAIVVAIIERAQRETVAAVEAVAAQVQGAPLADSVAALVDLAIAAQYDRSRLAAALDHEEQRLELGAALAPGHERVRAAIASVIGGHLPPETPDLVLEAADDLFLLVRSMVDHAGAAGLPRDQTRRRVLRAALGYLEACRRTDR
jgi:AcrR family transcriptional regulator